MVDVVLHPLAAALDQAGRLGGALCVDDVGLGRHLALTRDDDEPLAAGGPHAHEEAVVVLLQHQHVVYRGGPEEMAPYLPGAQGVVGSGVPQHLAIGAPGRRVVDVGDLVGPVGPRGQVPESQGVALPAGQVHGVGQARLVGTDVEQAEGEVVRACRQLVLVQQHLLAGGALLDQGQDLGRAQPALRVRPPAMDRVLRALDGAAVVPPGPLAGGGAHVGLPYPAADLLEQRQAEVRQGRQDFVGVGILGLEIGDHLGVVGVGQPVPVVLALIVVGDQVMGASGCARGRAHVKEPSTLGASTARGTP